MVSVTHKFRSVLADDGDTSLIQPSNWNDEHSISGSFSFALNIYTPEDRGYVTNRGDDASAIIQSILTEGNICRLNSGEEYTIFTRVVISVPGTGIVSDGTGLLIMSDASGAFDNTSSSAGTGTNQRYGPNSCGIYATSLARPIVQGVRIRYGVSTGSGTDNRYVKALFFSSCTDIVCDSNEAYHFSKSLGVLSFADCTRGSICKNHIHDCTFDAGPVAGNQLTGIEIDNDHNVGSTGLIISGNIIHDLTVGATALAAIGYQTDGINICGADAIPTHHCLISNNYIANVGEGIDCFGSDNIIVGNNASNCYNAAYKFVHGASRNVLKGNIATACGLYGIAIGGTSAHTTDTADNLIDGNFIYKIDPNAIFTTSSVGIVIEPNGGTTYLCRRNRIINNTIDCNGTGYYGIVGLAAGTLNEISGNRISNYVSKAILVDATTAPYTGGAHPPLIKILAADATGANSTSAQPWFPAAGTITLEVGTYKLSGLLWVTNGSTSRTVSTSFTGTATCTLLCDILAQVSASDTTQSTQQATLVDAASATSVIPASTGTSWWMKIQPGSIVRVTVAGTFIPNYTFSADPTGTISSKKNSFIELVKISSDPAFASYGPFA